MKDNCVSIFMLTYNQEDFIAQAIEGVLSQETNFPYQLVIGEDCSTDRTRTICEEYAESNPERIKLLPSNINLGLIKNFIRTYKECDGKYVAICDGDDYWIDPLKLQKQVNFLEGNLGYSLVFSSFKFLFTDGRFAVKNYEDQRETTGFEDLIFQNFICSATALFRNKRTPDDFPDWLDHCPYGDWPLYLWTTRDGSKIKFINEVTAVYRREIGVSEKMKKVPSSIASSNYEIVRKISADSSFNHLKQVVSKSLVDHKFQLMGCFIREEKIVRSAQLGFELFSENPLKASKIFLYNFKKSFSVNYKE